LFRFALGCAVYNGELFAVGGSKGGGGGYKTLRFLTLYTVLNYMNIS